MTATVTMNITPVNDSPTVNPSALVIDEDTSGSNNVEGTDIENDTLTYVHPLQKKTQLTTSEDKRLMGQLSATDIDGDPLMFQFLESQQKGDFSIINDKTGEFLYFPNANYFGSDQIRFHVADSHGEESNIAWLVIHIDAINDQPIAYSDTLIINEDQKVISQLHGTDVDADPI